MTSKLRVLITGATGFLGSHVAEILAADGHEIRALVRASSNTRLLEGLGAQLARGSFDPALGLEDAVRGVDAIVHCAGGGKLKTEADLFRQNTQATCALLDAARANAPRLRRFVFVSSLSAHGPSPDGVARLDTSPGAPVSSYGRSKLDAETAVLAARDVFPVNILRPPGIYGPRDDRWLPMYRSVRRGLIPLVSRDAVTSIIHGEDCARAIRDMLVSEPPSGSAYAIEDGRARSWREIGETIARALDVRAVAVTVPRPILNLVARASEAIAERRDTAAFFTRDKMRDAVQPYWVCSAAALTRDTGWRPQIEFERGVRSTADWYRREGLL